MWLDKIITMKFIQLILFIGLSLNLSLNAQDFAQNKGHAWLVKFNYAAQFPGGDLSSRFGNNSNLGTGIDFITSEGNWLFGLEGGFIFGSDVKTNVLEDLQGPSGNIIGSNGGAADIQLKQRGFYIGGLVGKILRFSSKNPRTGFRITLGAGLLQHKIRIQNDPQNDVPQLSNQYKKGYDRLTNGLALNQFIGYQVLGLNKRLNFYAGLEFTQGFTKSRRSFNFDTRSQDTENRVDLLFGIRIGWILPFYFGKGSDEIYY